LAGKANGGRVVSECVENFDLVFLRRLK